MTDQEQAALVERAIGDYKKCWYCHRWRPTSEMFVYGLPKRDWSQVHNGGWECHTDDKDCDRIGHELYDKRKPAAI